jgi:hypothetical protein
VVADIPCIQPAKDFVEGREQKALDVAPVSGAPLHHPNEVVHLHFPMIDRSGLGVVLGVLRLGHSKGRRVLSPS